MTTPIIGPASLTPEWFEARKHVTTATDIARILGGKEGYVVYLEKTGQMEGFAGNQFTRRGQRYERPILEEYAEDKQALVYGGVPLLIDGDCPALAATPDAVAIPGAPSVCGFREQDAVGLFPDPLAWGVEAKFSMSPAISRQLGEEESDSIPDKWVWQTQTQMAVTGWQYVDVAVLLFGRLRVYKVARNDRLVDQCRAVATDMMDRVNRGTPPEIDFSVPAAQDAIRSLHKGVDGPTIDLSSNALTRWSEYQALGVGIKEMEARRKAAQAEVLAEMKDAGVGRLGDGLILKRSTVERKEYTVKATSFIQLRQVKE
jgi:hypothetical protein